MMLETAPSLIRLILPAMGLYIVCSLLAAALPHRWIGMVVYIVAIAVVVPVMASLGAYGTYHVALRVGWWFYPGFLLLLVVKTFFLMQRDKRLRRLQARAGAAACCQVCGSDLIAGDAQRQCVECGAVATAVE